MCRLPHKFRLFVLSRRFKIDEAGAELKSERALEDSSDLSGPHQLPQAALEFDGVFGAQRAGDGTPSPFVEIKEKIRLKPTRHSRCTVHVQFLLRRYALTPSVPKAAGSRLGVHDVVPSITCLCDDFHPVANR